MPSLDDAADAMLALRAGRTPFVVGLTGGVAAGKSTLAAALVRTLAGRDVAVEAVSTDGFLRPNAALDAAGLTRRKGFPESYDTLAMAAALQAARAGGARFPVYSHLTYDVDPSQSHEIGAVEVLIVEGLGFGATTPVDALVYLDAAEADLEAWYCRRFLDLWAAGRDDATSFYHRFRSLDAEGAEALARAVWASVNLPNLRQNIAPLKSHSHLMIRKDPRHGLEALSLQVPAQDVEEPSSSRVR